MQIKQFLLTGVLCAVTLFSLAQNKFGTLIGKVIDDRGQPIPAASITLQNTTFGAVSNEKGFYQITNIIPGEYQLKISLIGFAVVQKHLQIKAGEQVQNITLKEVSNELGSVSVIGRTTNQEVNRQAYNITSIDAKKLYNSTLDLAHALDKVSGVRVREAGGVGSRTDLSLNGFTGNQVKFFLDGVPMDNFGSSFQINNIPINFAERVEVYKGVVPIWLGGDALGGAVNIVTNNDKRTYLDASYSYGSFNTHRTAINAGYTAKSGFTVQLNAFQNYSDNNYWVKVDVADLFTGAYFPNQRVRRFHDNYHNETVIANVGVVRKKYADKLLFGITLGKNKADIHTGARMVTVYGNWYRTGDIVMPSVRYQKKDLLVKGLSVSATGNYNFGHEQNIDTVNRRYNWFGQYKVYAGDGAERARSLYRSQNHNGLATANATYELNEHHSFIINNTYNTFNRTGQDELYPQSARYQQPSRVDKNVVGAGYRFQYNEKWNTSIFIKQFNQHTTYSRSYNPSTTANEISYIRQEANSNKTGYGFASSYYLLSNLQLKASYEKSYRLPSADELFGDQINVTGNLGLRPETSNNYNISFSLQKSFNQAHVFSFDGGCIYRDSKDFIRPLLNSNQITQTNGNLASVTNAGVDGEIRYSYKKFFTAGVNMTYQNLRNNQRYEDGQTEESPLYRDRIPNMPFMYGNANAAIFLNNIGKRSNALSFGYNLLYVHAYYLSWPSQGSEKLDIPQQFAHDVNTTYTVANGKYNFSLECKNLLDNLLYDNFTLQKPSRGFYFKVRYFFNKS